MEVNYLISTSFNCYCFVSLEEYMFCLRSARSSNMDYSIQVIKRDIISFVFLRPYK